MLKRNKILKIDEPERLLRALNGTLYYGLDTKNYFILGQLTEDFKYFISQLKRNCPEAAKKALDLAMKAVFNRRIRCVAEKTKNYDTFDITCADFTAFCLHELSKIDRVPTEERLEQKTFKDQLEYLKDHEDLVFLNYLFSAISR